MSAHGTATAIADQAPSARFEPRSAVGTYRRLLPLLVNRQTFTSLPSLLMIAAFAACAALLLTVCGGVWAFMHWPVMENNVEITYKLLAAFAACLLLVPAVTLGQAAATLSTRREDERLSTLSLLGASRTTITLASVTEPVLMSMVGIVGGIGGNLLLLLPVSLIPFQGSGLGYGAMLLPWWMVGIVALVLLAVSAGSALMGLRRIVVSPLGVATKSLPRTFPWTRIVVAAVLVVAVGVALTLSKSPSSVAVAVASFFAMVLLGLWLLDVLGVLVVRLVAHIRTRTAKTASMLVAARLVQSAPKQYWRRVSGLAMTAFTATFAGTGVAMMTAIDSDVMTQAERNVMSDMRTGIFLTLGIAFVFIAVSAVLNQAADIYDRKATYRELWAAGMSERTVRQITVQAVMLPVVWVSIVAGGLGLLLVLPVAGFALVMSPGTFLTLLASVAVGALIVRAGLTLTNPLVRRVTVLD